MVEIARAAIPNRAALDGGQLGIEPPIADDEGA